MPNRTSAAMQQAIQHLLHILPPGAVRTMTADRGKEFACYTWVEQQGIPFYFADAYAAWQRGSNENSNGLLREFFPKKTDFGTVTADELLRALMLSQACKFAGIPTRRCRARRRLRRERHCESRRERQVVPIKMSR